MPKVSEAHRESRRQQITRAALRCFARTGFQATSMADIIAESGLSAGAIYGHYSGKEELVQRTISEVLDGRFLEVAEARLRTPPPAPGEILALLINGLRSQVGELQVLAQVWGQIAINPSLRSISDGLGGRVRGMFADYLTEWYQHSLGLDAAAAASLAVQNAPVYVGIVQGYVTQTTLFSDFDGDAYLAAAGRMRPDV